MIRNIRHIQIKKIAYSPRLFQAILTYEEPNNQHDESDDIEYTKYLEKERITLHVYSIMISKTAEIV